MKEVKESFKLIGLKLKGKTTNLNKQSAKDCGSLWQKFETEKIFNRIKGRLSNEIYAVYYDYEKDENSPFSYFIGCKTDTGYKPPEGLSELMIPAQKYEKFLAKGPMTACISTAWEKIWDSDVNRKFGFDFEIYDERSHDWNNAEVAILISIAEEG